MEIRLVSTLTAEDEDRVADALLTALAELLDSLPIAYALQIDTMGSKLLQRSNVESPHAHRVAAPPHQTGTLNKSVYS